MAGDVPRIADLLINNVEMNMKYVYVVVQEVPLDPGSSPGAGYPEIVFMSEQQAERYVNKMQAYYDAAGEEITLSISRADWGVK